MLLFQRNNKIDVKASFASRPLSSLMWWYNTGDITKEFWEKAIQFHETFHGLKITNWNALRSQSDNEIWSGAFSSRIDVTSRQLIFWEVFTHNFLRNFNPFWAIAFIKNGLNFAQPRLF